MPILEIRTFAQKINFFFNGTPIFSKDHRRHGHGLRIGVGPVPKSFFRFRFRPFFVIFAKNLAHPHYGVLSVSNKPALSARAGLDKWGKDYLHHFQRFCCTLSLCTYPSFLGESGVVRNTSHQDPNGKSYNVFDDKVGFFSPIVYFVAIIFAAGAGADQSEEQGNSKWVV